MTTMPSNPALEQRRAQAIQLARQGEHAQARDLLRQVLSLSPSDELTLLWLVQVSSDRAEQIGALERVLALNPGHVQARQRLAELRRAAALEAAAVPPRTPGLQPAYVAAAAPLAPLLVVGQPSPAAATPRPARSWGVIVLGGLLLCLGLIAATGTLYVMLTFFSSDLELRLGEETPGHTVSELMVMAFVVFSCFTSLPGGIGLLLRRRWGWSSAMLLLGTVLGLTSTYFIVLIAIAILTSDTGEAGRLLLNFIPIALVQLGLLYVLARASVIRELNVSPRYRTRFIIGALLLGIALLMVPTLLRVFDLIER